MTKTIPKIRDCWIWRRSVYRWKYVANTNAKAARKAIHFASMKRIACASLYYQQLCGTLGVCVAPPKGVAQCQMT